ncbi:MULTISPECIES: hypothetical protein [unclassified Beijerinckia]|uniref:hypothetical protein n=1 Tax=unclassified Beijerinckia TaxID=2638183 RepID=UPI000895CA30|nr:MULTISPECIES: hypothetical protein [unclassified Beijerinckia]MDH7795532.1 hypothetical protein [Beijerinckia sp. GAS462]SEC05468.1 hypothetical protein SAMN05443249_1807 [Beijerinckia sp. 28-YEA-48]
MSNLISMIRSETFLRRILVLDGATCVVMGAALLLGAEALSELLAIDGLVLRGAGAVLQPFAAFVFWTASRSAVPAWAVWTIVGLNLLWAVESVASLAVGWLAPNALGVTFVVAQAVAVAVIAELEMMAIRRPAQRTA